MRLTVMRKLWPPSKLPQRLLPHKLISLRGSSRPSTSRKRQLKLSAAPWASVPEVVSAELASEKSPKIHKYQSDKHELIY